jgi:hypothetical protein
MRGSQFDKSDSNLRPLAFVNHQHLRHTGELEAKVAIIATFFYSATKKMIFFENQSKDRLKNAFLANGICFEISVRKSSTWNPLEMKSRLNKNQFKYGPDLIKSRMRSL